MSRYDKNHITFFEQLLKSRKLKSEFKKDYQILDICQLQRKYRIQYREVYAVIDKLNLKPRRNKKHNRGIWRSINDIEPKWEVMDFGIIVKYSEKFL